MGEGECAKWEKLTAALTYLAEPADLAASVAARGWTVISGGAYGIDAAS